MASEITYDREFTLDGLRNLNTVLKTTAEATSKTGWIQYIASTGFTVLGFVPLAYAWAIATGIAGLMFGNINSIKDTYLQQITDARFKILETLDYMSQIGATKCKAYGGAIQETASDGSSAYVPYNFYVNGYYINGRWIEG